jgi:hypothetical protein
MNIVEQIHNEIDTAQDRLYNDAISLINETDSFKQMVERTERLKRLGFTSTETVIKTEKYITISDEAKKKTNLIVHYKTTYPFLKFLTMEEFERICDKYDLIYAPVQNYKKDVPEKNLIDIENAQKLNTEDQRKDTYSYKVGSYFEWVPLDFRYFLENLVTEVELKNDKEFKEICPIKFDNEWVWISGTFSSIKTNYNGLFIAAPKEHFELENLTQHKKGFFKTEIFKPEPKDPIVFRHVVGGVQVLTKWGAEANDPILINPIDN